MSRTIDLFLLEDLEDAAKASELAEGDLTALRTVADWIRSYVVRPHKDLGRAGPVCPFVPAALERRTLWLAPEHAADLSASAVAELMDGHKRRFLEVAPADGDDANKVLVVVFTDLPADRASGVFDGVLEQLAVPSYAEDGIVFGPFYEGNEGTALRNSSFRPFQSPVPFLFVRYTVIGDWRFFLDKEDWLNLWARRFGEFAVHALAEELRLRHEESRHALQEKVPGRRGDADERRCGQRGGGRRRDRGNSGVRNEVPVGLQQ